VEGSHHRFIRSDDPPPFGMGWRDIVRVVSKPCPFDIAVSEVRMREGKREAREGREEEGRGGTTREGEGRRGGGLRKFVHSRVGGQDVARVRLAPLNKWLPALILEDKLLLGRDDCDGLLFGDNFLHRITLTRGGDGTHAIVTLSSQSRRRCVGHNLSFKTISRELTSIVI
jgi:hypothetical protein